MTRGRDENIALVVTDTPELAEAIRILEAAIAIDRADIPATTHRRTVAVTVPRPGPRLEPRVEIPEWFDELRTTAEENRRAAQRVLDDRNVERAVEEKRVVDAGRCLPAAKAAHAPFAERVAAATRVVNEARSGLCSSEYELGPPAVSTVGRPAAMSKQPPTFSLLPRNVCQERSRSRRPPVRRSTR